MWTINLPLRVPVSKKNDFIINLNNYRNAHFLVLNKAKIMFKEQVAPLLRHIPRLDGCTLLFTLFPGSMHLCDVSNVCSVQEKFFNDTFVECGKLEDDNYTFVPESRYNFGRVDKDNPRVEVTIYPTGEILSEPLEEEEMQITLVQAEIEQAIQDFVRGQITVKDGMDIKIDLRATRGADGATALIDIVPSTGGTPVTAAAPVANKPGPKPVVRPAPTAETLVAATPAPAPEKAAAVVNDPIAAAILAEPQAQENAANDEVEESTPAPAAPVKSLFAGLGKPKNAVAA